MSKKSHNLELLAPAGSLEKLKYAIHYGADAVYAGVPEVSMRARMNNFDNASIAEATQYAHAQGVKIYVTLNIYAHNHHLEKIEKHLRALKKIPIDGVIISDPGILLLVKKYLPKVDIHLSTQANTTNWQAAKFWWQQGVKRIVLAREVTLEDIKKIHQHVPKLELEYFVHGAMCMSYSGRCLLSKWMSGKSANLGDCSQPCRWSYRQKRNTLKSPKTLTAELEETQKSFGVDLEEDRHGTYFFNSKDLNLITHLADLREAGVTSFKIEGRNKSVAYVAMVTRAYRAVLDALESRIGAKECRKIVRSQEKELELVVNRGYTKGFLLGMEPEHNFFESHTAVSRQFVGEVIESEGKILKVKVHNALIKDDILEAVTKDKILKTKIKQILNADRQAVATAHGGHGNLYYLEVDKAGIGARSLLRKVL